MSACNDKVAEAIEEFLTFHRANPHVYALFRRFAAEAINAGKLVLSSRFIVERIRWEIDVVTRSRDSFKINDHVSPYYGRLFCFDFPQYAELFEHRLSMADQMSRADVGR